MARNICAHTPGTHIHAETIFLRRDRIIGCWARAPFGSSLAAVDDFCVCACALEHSRRVCALTQHVCLIKMHLTSHWCASVIISFDAFLQSHVLLLSPIRGDTALAVAMRACVCVYILIMWSTQCGSSVFFCLKEGIIWGNLTALGSPMVKLESSPRCCSPQCRWTDQHSELFPPHKTKRLLTQRSVYFSPTQTVEKTFHHLVCAFRWTPLLRQIANRCQVFHLLNSFSNLASPILKRTAKNIPAFNIWMLLNATFESHRGW